MNKSFKHIVLSRKPNIVRSIIVVTVVAAAALLDIRSLESPDGFIGIGSANAELWKCTAKGSTNPTFTETPSFGDDVDCESVSGGRFSKPGQGGADPKKRGNNSGKKVFKEDPHNPVSLVKKMHAGTKRDLEKIRSSKK